jgi:hypothetical protein
LRTKVASLVKSSVWPSGADFATASAPIAVLAPVRLSMMTGCLSASASFSPICRPTMSVVPPGA